MTGPGPGLDPNRDPDRDAELRAWLDRLLNVVDGLVDDVRELARAADHDGRLFAHGASRELVDLQAALYRSSREDEP